MNLQNTKNQVKMPNQNTKTSNKTSSKKKEKLPFLENNFRFSPPKHTQTPNELFDLLAPSLKEGELRVILFLIRKTYGWHLKWEKITYEEIEIGTGMKKDACIKSTNSLVEKGLVEKIQTGSINHLENYYRLRMDEDSNNVSGYSKNTPPGYSKNTPPPSALKKPRKKLIKDNTESPETPLPKTTPKKAATAPSSPIIIFLKYEWFNAKTELYETIETGMTEEEYEKVKNKIGESNFHKAINKIQSILDKPKNQYRYSNKNLPKKVLDMHRDGEIKMEDKKQKQKEQALREGIKYVEEISEQEKLERYAKKEFEIAKKFQYDNPDLRKYIRVLEQKDGNLVVHRKIEIMHCSKNNRWDTIKTPEPRIEEKLEKWAKDIRYYKS